MTELSKIIINVVAPESTARPFRVTLRSEDGAYAKAEYTSANSKAVFSVPEGRYWLSVRADTSLNPNSQSKWVHTHPCGSACYTAIFRGTECTPEPTVDIYAVDAYYPGIIPINGGITYMAKSNHVITFANGVASNVTLPVGEYTFVPGSITIPGYTNATATNFTITSATQTVTLQLTANGVLNVTVQGDPGTPIVGAKLQMSNSSGTTDYGTAATTDTQGQASFNHLPYGTTENPTDLWVHQLNSDASHAPIDAPQAVSMGTTPKNIDITNQRLAANITMNASDANYPGITPISGQITYNG